MLRSHLHTTSTPPVITASSDRGCGTRTGGHVYSATAVSPSGTVIFQVTNGLWEEERLDWFNMCPPEEVDLKELGLASVGVQVLPRANSDTLIYDIWDVIGAEHYPYWPLFYDEGMRMGFSRKAQGIDYSLLSVESRHVFIHPKGTIENFDELFDQRITDRMCPAGIARHNAGEKIDFCNALLWDAVGDPNPLRTMLSNEYKNIPDDYIHRYHHWPKDFKPIWRPAIMMELPITSLELSMIHILMDSQQTIFKICP